MKKIAWLFLVLGMLLSTCSAKPLIESGIMDVQLSPKIMLKPAQNNPNIQEIAYIKKQQPEVTATKPNLLILPSATATSRVLMLEPAPLSGGDVAAVQTRLLALGYGEVGKADGIYDQQTELAVRHFQLLNNLPLTGVVGDLENTLLFSRNAVAYSPPPVFPRNLRKNFLLDDGHSLHDRLATLGYMTPDQSEWQRGFFGEETARAVMRFQKDNKLTPTGIVDYITWKMMFSLYTAPIGGSPLLRLDDANDWQSDIIRVGEGVIGLAYAGNRLWVLQSTGPAHLQNTILPLAADTKVIDPLAPISAGDARIQDNTVSGMVMAGNLLWLLFPNGKGSGAVPDIAVFHPGTGELVKRFSFGECPEGFCFPSSALGYDGRLVWASAGERAWGMEVPSGRVIRSYPVGWLASGGMIFDGACLWMQGEAGMTAFHPGGGKCPYASEGYQLYGDMFVSDGRWLWYTCLGCSTIQAFDPKTGVIYEPVEVDGSISAMTFDGKRIWLADASDSSVSAFNPKTGAFGEAIAVIDNPSHLLHDGKLLWIASASSGLLQHVDVSNYTMPQITATPLPATATATPRPVPTKPPLGRSLSLTTPNMTGQDVQWMQERLQELGYSEVGTPDGLFGPKTDQAVRRFQSVNGLVVDGIVGPITWARLYSAEAKSP